MNADKTTHCISAFIGGYFLTDHGMEETAAAAAAGFRPTTARESPGHGITRSSRRQNQTDLSKIFSTSLLILSAWNNLLYAHHGSSATLLKLSMVSTAKPCADSSWPMVARL